MGERHLLYSAAAQFWGNTEYTAFDITYKTHQLVHAIFKY